AISVAWFGRRLKISEFRQQWINEQRKDVADYLGATQRWFAAYAKGEEAGKLFLMGNEASVILYRIKMRVNPLENPDKAADDAFIASLEKLRNPDLAPSKQTAEAYWGGAPEEVLRQAQLLFKREWTVTKKMGFPWADS